MISCKNFVNRPTEKTGEGKAKRTGGAKEGTGEGEAGREAGETHECNSSKRLLLSQGSSLVSVVVWPLTSVVEI